MFKKILFAEDIDMMNIAIRTTLEELGCTVHHAKYCDDALLLLKKSLADGEPFDLVLTDLSFEPDHREVLLQSGEDLIMSIRILQPDLPILVCSIEDKSYRIKNLFTHYKINAFVHKSRKTLPELQKALEELALGERYISPDLEPILRDKLMHEIDDYDVELIRQLASGIAQEKMDAKLSELGIFPNSKSTIEKRINRLKIYFEARNTVHLVAIAKDLGIV